jgi:hypothetical protein
MEILAVLLAVIASGATFLALLITLTLIFPVSVERIRQKLETSPLRATLLGLVNVTFLVVLVALFGWLGDQFGSQGIGGIFIAIALILLAAGSLLALFGLAAASQLVGLRMGETNHPASTQARGGALLLLAGLTPYLGWFLFAPLAICAGLGAAIQSLLQRKTVAQTEAE